LPGTPPHLTLALEMIEDVDESLRQLVRSEVLNGDRVDIAFDAPTREWAAQRSLPTLDLYLYDIREELERREAAWQPVRDDDGRVVSRRPPFRHYLLSYLVTAWTQRPEDEHRLLSAVLSCFIRFETLPEGFLSGVLAGGPPVRSAIAMPPRGDRAASDLWSVLGSELRPSLDLVVPAPLEDRRSEAAGPPVLEQPTLEVRGPPAEERAGGGVVRIRPRR
jgi:hypothetical protein